MHTIHITSKIAAETSLAKENVSNPIKTISDSLNACPFDGVNMHIDNHKEDN